MIEQSILPGAQYFYFSTLLVSCRVYIKFDLYKGRTKSEQAHGKNHALSLIGKKVNLQSR